MTEPLLPEPPPRAPRYVERTVPTCPDCRGLVRRDLLAMTSEGQHFGPWRCDLHGELKRIRWEAMEVPAGDD